MVYSATGVVGTWQPFAVLGMLAKNVEVGENLPEGLCEQFSQ